MNTNHNKYYELLSGEAREKFSKLTDDKNNLVKQIEQAKAKLEDEKSRLERVKVQIAKLQDLAGQALTDGQNSYESFKVNLKKRIVERETLEEVITALEKTILPGLREKFALANRKLNDCLKIWTREKVKICEGAMTEAFDKYVIGEYDDFKDSMTRIWADFGEGYPAGRSDTSPGLVHPRHSPKLLGYISDISSEERVKRIKGEKK